MIPKETTQMLEDLGKAYEKQPVIRSLIQLVPCGIGSAFDTALTMYVSKIRQERTRIFFDELAKGNILLTPEQIANEDFLHAYFATVKAALNTRKHQKIRLFARLLNSFSNEKTDTDTDTDTDTYEELLAVLDDLTIREVLTLLLLRDLETKVSFLNEKENPCQRATRFWNSFFKHSRNQGRHTKLGNYWISDAANRTGLYQTFVGYMDNTGDKG